MHEMISPGCRNAVLPSVIIVASVLFEMLQDLDREKADRVIQAMLQMTKIDIARLRQAYDGR